MDEMKVGSKFTKNMISKLVRSILRKKFGYDIDIQLNEMNVTITDGKIHVHLNADAGLETSELMKILKNGGFD